MNRETISIKPENDPFQSRRLSRTWRYTLSGLLLVITAAALIYEILDAARLKQSSALFIGLPLLIGLLVINLSRASGLYGQVLRANVIGLVLVAPLLGEGSICLLMAAPLFIAFSMLMVVLYDLFRSPRSLLCLALIPLLLGIIEKHTTILAPEPEVVTTTARLEGSIEEWRTRVQQVAPVAGNHSFFLSLGFPLPASYIEDGDQVQIAFQMGQRPAGVWRVQRQLTADGVHFRLITDSTEINNWIKILDSQVIVQEGPAGSVQLTQTTRFTPLLFPLWYFVPFERYALEQAHLLALASWQESGMMNDE